MINGYALLKCEPREKTLSPGQKGSSREIKVIGQALSLPKVSVTKATVVHLGSTLFPKGFAVVEGDPNNHEVFEDPSIVFMEID